MNDYFSIFFRFFVCPTLISLDVSLRYPVIPDVSSRPRRAALFVVGILFYVLILFPFYFPYRPMKMILYFDQICDTSLSFFRVKYLFYSSLG